MATPSTATPYRSAAKLRRDRCLSEIAAYQNLLTQTLSNLGLTGAKGGGMVSKTLNAANIKAMNGAPITLVAAPGSGNTLYIVGPIAMIYTEAGAAFTSGGNIVIQYHTGPVAASEVLAASQLGASSTYNLVAALPDTSTTLNPVTNDALEITNATGAFAGSSATGTLLVQFAYRIA